MLRSKKERDDGREENSVWELQALSEQSHTSAPQSPEEAQREEPVVRFPTLWFPIDRPGRNGARNRRQRLGRLWQSLSLMLTIDKVRDLLTSCGRIAP